jgi:DNA primase
MDNSKYVLGLLESVLGKSKPDKNGADHVFNCPVCKHKKPKLVVNIKSGQYNCWTCHPPTKGKSPVSLFKKLGVDADKQREMKSYFVGDKTTIDNTNNESVQLPKEFISLSVVPKNPNLEYRRAVTYLKKRGINQLDIKKYNIGYCDKGRFRHRIIVPSYDSNGKLNYFIARSYEPDPYLKYDAPSCAKSEIIGFEYFINWKVPVILCEGAFDAIAIKRNVIPIFGKTIPQSLMLKLAESRVKTVYLALDKDALKESLTYAENLINMGKEVYLIELGGKDPSDIGFENITKLLHSAKQLTFADLFIKKIQLA